MVRVKRNIVQEFELFRFLTCQIIEQIGSRNFFRAHREELTSTFRAMRRMNLGYLTIDP